MLNRILLLLTVLMVSNSCTRDDICADGTATTPMLIITFNDINNPAIRKSVTGLVVSLSNSTQTFIPNSTNDSIALPLNPNAGITSYFFNRDIGGPTANVDKVAFTYTPYSVYVNRACGYKINYSGLEGTIEAGNGENWIQRIEINTPTVENENKAHITILH